MIFHGEGGRGGLAKSDFVGQGGIRVGKKYFFLPIKNCKFVSFFHFMSYSEPNISLFSWSSNKSEKGIG